MAAEKEKTLTDFIKFVSPGSSLRGVINDLVRSELGALIVIDSPELHSQGLFEGGFRINCRFTPQKLFELGKMDGAIILSPDLKRILHANVLMTPDKTIHTNETGTRHKAAEKIARQAHTLTIAVSERKRKTTLYHNQSKYVLKSSEELIRTISSALQVLEKQRELFNEQINNLNILEMSELVSVGDVCNVIQKAEMILKISETIKRHFTEIGKEGNIMHMRYRELILGIEKKENDLIRDYASFSLKKTKILLSNLTFDGLLDLEAIARLTVEKNLEESITPRGYRFLSHLQLNEREISLIVKECENLNGIISQESTSIEQILKNRTESIKEEISKIREQILSGKVIY